MKFSRLNYIETFFCFLSAFFILSLLSNNIGYEGDDLNTVLPMLHLQDAKKGNLLLYRYYWQPLSYEIGSVVYNFTKSINAIFLLPQLFMAISISIIYRCCVSVLGFDRKLFVPLILLFPEIIYTGLYFNSTAIAFPFVCISVMLALERKDWKGAIFTGLFLSLAVMIRFDFILITPFVFIYRYFLSSKLSDAVIGGLFFVAGIIISMLSGVLVPDKIFEVYDLAHKEIIQRNLEPGWDFRTKLFVTTTVFSPIGWGVLASATFWCFKTKKVWKPTLLGLICLIPILLSARDILTPKYMMPMLAIAPVLVVMLWSRTVKFWSEKYINRLSLYWIILTVGFFMFSIEPIKTLPFLKVSAADNRQVGTHDGERSWGSYFWQLRRVATTISKESTEADELLALFKNPGSHDVVLVGDENFFSSGGVAWRHLQLRLEREGFYGRVVELGQIEYKVPSGTVTLSTKDNKKAGACMVRLEEISTKLENPADWIKLNCDYLQPDTF